ncbi:hypothetical protein [Desulfosporosinus metallidurans]|uniref:Uncharacterized protein n=1 Tax=Desulfosporosinus metallidurans TaxID=1888891 RepID=A0A1Q8R001_9FIRM|nr:hypothetical protein [Desulfosporosinus metallidurans]OLN32720.1 hypothetical protein DSOL_1471 [Desulfosporosinus metallidurans]
MKNPCEPSEGLDFKQLYYTKLGSIGLRIIQHFKEGTQMVGQNYVGNITDGALKSVDRVSNDKDLGDIKK